MRWGVDGVGAMPCYAACPMDALGRSLASMIESAALGLAAGVVVREPAAELPPGFAPRPSAVFRLQVFGHALAVGIPDVFAEHVAWEKVALRARDVPDGYLPAHIDALEEELLEQLPEIGHDRIRQQCAATRRHLEAAPFELPSGLMQSTGPHTGLARQFLLDVLEGRKREAVDRLMASEVAVLDVYRHVLQPVLEEVGRMWQQSQLHTAEEHFATAVAEQVLSLMSMREREREHDGRIAVVSSVADNMHSLGARLVADVLERDGWRAMMLGANMPAADLPAAVRDFEAHLVALSITLPTHLITAADTVATVRRVHPSAKVLVGGKIVTRHPQLAQVLGADGGAGDCVEAAIVASRLVPSV